jgi:predicted DNA-binding protein with PD1-like motif
MKYTQGSIGRMFVLRMEDGDVLNDTLEAFAIEQGLQRGLAFYVGGSADGSRLVVGPDATRTDAVIPLIHALCGPHETFAVGTIFPDETGRPAVHMHAASGREGGATVGCARAGLETWLVGEVVLLEILGTEAHRETDAATGFGLLTLS